MFYLILHTSPDQDILGFRSHFLVSRHQENKEDISSALTDFFSLKSPKFLRQKIGKLPGCLVTAIANNGNYFID